MLSTLATGLALGHSNIDNIDGSAKNLEQGARSSFRQTYHEIADRHVVETNVTDVIEQLRANLAQLEDLQGRMKFMMSEVAYLLKKN